MDADAVIPNARLGVLPALGGAVTTRAWFEAASSAGPLRLCGPGTVRHAADAGILLHRCSELLDALEDWTATGLGWRWIAPPTPTTPESHVSVAWRAGEPARGGDGAQNAAWQIELPWALVRALPAPVGALGQRLRWSEVPVVLAAAQIHLSADELQQLETGGAVILPESLRPDWRGLLRAFDEPAFAGWGMPVAFGAPLAAARVPGRSSDVVRPSEGDGAWCEVRFEGPRTLAGDRLAGWFQGDLGDLGARASLWRCATEFEAARPLASGRLMPWGDGWALALEVLCEPPRPAPVVHGYAEAGFKGHP
jgi:hypothetical protein